MKPFFFSVLAMVFYALGNVIVESRFSKYNTLALMACYCSVVAFAAFFMLQTTKISDVHFPVGKDLILVMILGLIFFFGDYFYIGAYTSGGSLLAITSITVMFPLVASLMKFFVSGGLPNIWQVSGYAAAIIAMILVAIGNKN